MTLKTLCQGAERVKKARIQTLKDEFESMNMKDMDSLDDFCLKMNGLVTNIRALAESVADSYVVKKITPCGTNEISPNCFDHRAIREC